LPALGSDRKREQTHASTGRVQVTLVAGA